MAIGHWQLAIGHWQLAIGHWQFIIGNLSLVIGHGQSEMSVQSEQTGVSGDLESLF